jgi:hypothetical protein
MRTGEYSILGLPSLRPRRRWYADRQQRFAFVVFAGRHRDRGDCTASSASSTVDDQRPNRVSGR